MITAHALLTVAQQVETVAGEIYRVMAAQFAEQPEAARVFTTLAAEEVQHALRVQMLQSRHALRPLDFSGLGIDPEVMPALLKEALAFKEQLAAGPPLSLSEATRLLVNLEHRFWEAHAQVITGPENDELRSFFEDLARQDKMHVRMLQGLRKGVPL